MLGWNYNAFPTYATLAIPAPSTERYAGIKMIQPVCESKTPEITAPSTRAKYAVSFLYLGAAKAGNRTVVAAPMMHPMQRVILVKTAFNTLGDASQFMAINAENIESPMARRFMQTKKAVPMPKAKATGTKSQLSNIIFIEQLRFKRVVTASIALRDIVAKNTLQPTDKKSDELYLRPADFVFDQQRGIPPRFIPPSRS